jgi:hypothetical protein
MAKAGNPTQGKPGNNEARGSKKSDDQTRQKRSGPSSTPQQKRAKEDSETGEKTKGREIADKVTQG